MTTSKRQRARRKVPPVVGHTPCLRRAIREAETYARKMRHAYVGTDHMLLALLRENAMSARSILADCGLDPDRFERVAREKFENAFVPNKR